MDCDDPGLIQSNPICYAITESLKAHPRIPLEIALGFLEVQPTTIALVEALRQVPVVEGYPWRDTPSKEPIDQLVIERDTSLIDRVVPASKRNYAGPREREPVGFGTVLG